MQKQENAQDWLRYLGCAHVPFCFCAELCCAFSHCDICQGEISLRQLKLDAIRIFICIFDNVICIISDTSQWADEFYLSYLSSNVVRIIRNVFPAFAGECVKICSYFQSGEKLRHFKRIWITFNKQRTQFVSQFLRKNKDTMNIGNMEWIESVIAETIKVECWQKPSDGICCFIDKSNWDSTAVRKL